MKCKDYSTYSVLCGGCDINIAKTIKCSKKFNLKEPLLVVNNVCPTCGLNGIQVGSKQCKRCNQKLKTI